MIDFSILKCPSCGAEMGSLKCMICSFEAKEEAANIYNFTGTKIKRPDINLLKEWENNVRKYAFSKILIDESKKIVSGLKGKILDIGCGTGIYSREIFTGNKDVLVTGLDLNFSFNVHESKGIFNYIVADIFKAPFKDGVFDGVVSFDVIEHIEDDAVFIERIIALLKKKGKFLIGTPNRERLMAVLIDIIKGRRKFPYNYGNDPALGETIHVREYCYREIREIFSRYLDRIDFIIKPLFLGVSIKNIAIGIRNPGVLAKYCIYWIVYGEKKK